MDKYSSINIEKLRVQYEIEKEIAKRLKNSTREERKKIYPNMYNELFSKVPEHSRITKRDNDKLYEKSNIIKYKILESELSEQKTFVEFAPGDCKFIDKISKFFGKSYGVDISDQRSEKDKKTTRYDLIIYNGYDLNMEKNSVDLVFSDQLIEHLHEDDVFLHFELVSDILKFDGKYIFRTPHPITGPHDISKYFSDTPQGFHLKEWTCLELMKISKKANFSHFLFYYLKKNRKIKIPYWYIVFIEKIIPNFFNKKFEKLKQIIYNNIIMEAVK